jgi:uncharacterized protein (TIGR03435 family)
LPRIDNQRGERRATSVLVPERLEKCRRRRRSGLDGIYDLEVTFAPEAPGAPASDAPSLFTALQEQLGLKLDADKELVEVLVVSRIERPSEN